MTSRSPSANIISAAEPAYAQPRRRTAASYERELRVRMDTEVLLRQAISAGAALLAKKNALIDELESLGTKSDHLLLNGLQLIASLIALQDRTSANAELAARLAVAADRVAMITRVHRRLQSLDGANSFAFKPCLEDLCREYSAMFSSKNRPELAIAVVGADIVLPAATAIPLGYIVNELIANAAQYGDGRITVGLKQIPGNGFALSVANGGAILPDDFDPCACKGLGLKIVMSFVDRIGGELRIGRAAKNKGSKFTVVISGDDNERRN